MSRPYAEVIGDPIAQSKSPTIHNYWLGKLGIDAEYRACHVRNEELADYFRQRNADDDWRGCNVTMPHKQAVIPLLDRLDPGAKRIGAVNTVVMHDYFLEGRNTDGLGFLEPLRPLMANKEFRLAQLIGAGGAARAIADALHEEQFSINSYARDPSKAADALGRYVFDDCTLPLEELVREGQVDPFVPEPGRIDVVINATSLGMTGHAPLKITLPVLMEDEIVYDIVTHPLDTPLLQTARAAGLRTIDGLAMLIGQAAVAFEMFFGQPPPRDDGDRELRALLTV